VKFNWFTPSGTTLDGGLHLYVAESPGSQDISDSFAKSGGGMKGDTFFNVDFSSSDGRTCPPTGCDISEVFGPIAAFEVQWSDNSFYNVDFTSDIDSGAPEPPGLLLLGTGVLSVGVAIRRRFARQLRVPGCSGTSFI